MHFVAVDRKAGLKAMQPFGLGVHGQIESLAVILIHKILDRVFSLFVVRPLATSATQCRPMVPDGILPVVVTPTLWTGGFLHRPHPNTSWLRRSRLEVARAMKSVQIVSEGGVELADTDLKVRVGFVGDEQTIHFDVEVVAKSDETSISPLRSSVRKYGCS